MNMPLDDILMELGAGSGPGGKDAAQKILLEAMTQVRAAELADYRKLQQKAERMLFCSPGFWSAFCGPFLARLFPRRFSALAKFQIRILWMSLFPGT